MALNLFMKHVRPFGTEYFGHSSSSFMLCVVCTFPSRKKKLYFFILYCNDQFHHHGGPEKFYGLVLLVLLSCWALERERECISQIAPAQVSLSQWRFDVFFFFFYFSVRLDSIALCLIFQT